MFDVIAKTLPADPAERAALEEAEAFMRAQDARLQDAAMLERDEPKAKPEPAAEDPLAAVRDAIQNLRDEMFECARDEVQNTGRRDPDYARADAAEAELIAEVRKLLQPPVCDPVQVDASGKSDNGLLTSHNPDRRVL